jgi:hypothetical protein
VSAGCQHRVEKSSSGKRLAGGARYVLPRVHAPTESRGNFIVIKVQALTTPDHLNAETVYHFLGRTGRLASYF